MAGVNAGGVIGAIDFTRRSSSPDFELDTSILNEDGATWSYKEITSGSYGWVLDTSSSGGSGDAPISGADPTGAADSLAAIQAVIDAAGADSEVIIPNGTYLLTGPLQVSTDNTNVVTRPGTTLTASDVGGGVFGTLEIDDTKVGMPQMKAMVAFLSCTGSSISGGGTIDAAGLEFSSDAGMSGVYVRDCTRVLVEWLNVKNVFPDGYTYGGEGDKRYTGILILKSTSCVVQNNFVNHIKYDCIAARMENTDIQIINNKCWDALEGIQSSGQYGTVTPIEDNLRTVIRENECWSWVAPGSGIVFHSLDVNCSDNFIHTPDDSTGAIRCIGGETCKINGNTIWGTAGTSAEIATADVGGIRTGTIEPSDYSNNVIKYCNVGISFETAVSNDSNITGNRIWQCNTGIDLIASGDTTTRNHAAIVANNVIRAYRTGVRGQSSGPTHLIDNVVEEQSGWVGTSIGYDLDPNGNDDTAYIISGRLPTGFTTPVSHGAPPADPTSANFGTYFDQSAISAEQRYFNRGVVTISAGNTTGTDNLNTSLSPLVAPTGGEIQVTQMTGTPVAFKWSASTTVLTITIGSSVGDDTTFGWTVHFAGYVLAV